MQINISKKTQTIFAVNKKTREKKLVLNNFRVIKNIIHGILCLSLLGCFMGALALALVTMSGGWAFTAIVSLCCLVFELVQLVRAVWADRKRGGGDKKALRAFWR